MANIGACPGAGMRATAVTPIHIGHMSARSAQFAGVRHKFRCCSLSLAVFLPRLRPSADDAAEAVSAPGSRPTHAHR